MVPDEVGATPADVGTAMGEENCVVQESGAWSEEDTTKLLNLYAENKQRFASTAIKNHKVWLDITAHFPGRNVDQVKNRFKYLKTKYMKVKDSMGPNGTGKEKVKFKFFHTMDDMFGKEPNVQPVSVCDSTDATNHFPPLTTHNRPSDDEEPTHSSAEDDPGTPNLSVENGVKRKKKLRKVDVLTKQLAMRNETEEKKLEVQQAAVNALDRIASSFERYVEKLNT